MNYIIFYVAGVGKTSLVTKYVTKLNPKDVVPTIGASFFSCRITMDDIRVKMQVWDTAGQEKFRSMTPMYYRGANAALLVFDLTNYNTFVDIKSWVTELQRNVQDQMVMTLVGNKCDIPERAVSKEEVIQGFLCVIHLLINRLLFQATMYANSIGGYYFETSSLTNQGFHCIEKAFSQTALGLIHLSGEANSVLRRYESLDTLPLVLPANGHDTNLLMTSAISLGVVIVDDPSLGPIAESGRVENVAFSIDHIAHGDEHRTGCCW